MRLIRIDSYEFSEYPDERQAPRYGILSHRWQEEEVTYQDMLSGKCKSMLGFTKITAFCRTCAVDGLSHAWVDTCCIDKNSSAELSEAIDSMYRWYQNATKCYVFLSDVQKLSDLARSEWFDRGWTLQELIAPNDVQLYNRYWDSLGSKAEHRELIETVTKIPQDVLYGESPFNYSIAQRMSWAALRKTTRIEDQAYSLMGLFNVNMPMLYGEGEKAFTRLQEEIIKYSADHSIFAWPGIITEYDRSEMYDVTLRRLEGLLATSPAAFQFCRNIEWLNDNEDQQFPFSVTNLGLSLEVSLRPTSIGVFEAKLNCTIGSDRVSIFLCQTDRDEQYTRHSLDGKLSAIWTINGQAREERVRVNVVQGVKLDPRQVCQPDILLAPGPLSQKWSNALPSDYYKPRRSGTPEKSKVEVLHGSYGEVTQLQTKGGFDDLELIIMQFGFDFYFNPYLWLGNSHRGFSVDSLRASQDHEAVSDADLMGRDVIIKQGFPPNTGWLLTAHRSKGLFIWLVGLNTVIEIGKKALLSQVFWTIDVQKADPRRSHLLSCVSRPLKQDKLLRMTDVSREQLAEKDRCPICSTFLAVPVTTSCGHTFCQPCFRWANVSVKSSDLNAFPAKDIRESKLTTILCPICGQICHSFVDLHHQYKIQNEHPNNWRYTSWAVSQRSTTPSRFPAFEFLTFTIGNTHKMSEAFVDSRKRENRHDWTFFVRPSHPELIAGVVITLHESFRHNVIALTNPPFEIRRFGWGIFEILAQVTLKSQYFFLNDMATVESGRRRKLQVTWTLSFQGDGTESWLKVAVGRLKSRNTDHDLELLTQYGNLMSLQTADVKQKGGMR